MGSNSGTNEILIDYLPFECSMIRKGEDVAPGKHGMGGNGSGGGNNEDLVEYIWDIMDQGEV